MHDPRSPPSQLEEELHARRQLIVLLASSVERQNEQCAKLESALGTCESLLATTKRAEEQVAAMAAQMDSIAAAASEAL